MFRRYFCWDIQWLSVLPVFRRFIAIYTFSLCFLTLHAQSALIDSLVSELKIETLLDPIRVDMLNDLAEAYTDYDPKEIPRYARAALRLAEEIDYVSGQAAALDLLGFYFYDKRELETAAEYYDRALALAEQSGAEEVIFNVLGGKGIMLLEKAKYAEALDFFYQALDIGKANKLDDVAYTLSTIGWTHGNNGNDELEEQYIKECIAWAMQADDPDVQMHGLQQSGYLAWKNEEYDKALSAYGQALEIADLYQMPWNQERIIYSISKLYRDLEDYDKALENAEKAIAISHDLGDDILLCRNLVGVAELYVEMEAYDQAVIAGQKALVIADTLNIPDLSSRNLSVLTKAYEGQEDFGNALRFQEAYHALSDSLSNEETTRALAAQESVYQLDKKTIENELLLARQEEQAATISRQRTITTAAIIVVGLLAILGLILYRAYRTKVESSKKLEEEVAKRTNELMSTNDALVESNKLLERFAYATSHDMKEPLRNISSFAGLLRHEIRPEKNSKADEYIAFLIGGAKQLQRLVDDILDFSKFSNNDNPIKVPVDLHQVMGEIKYAISLKADQRPVTLTWSDDLPTVAGRHAKLLVLFKNIIENGIKFNDSDHPVIRVDYTATEDHDIIAVTDNGIGIETNYYKGIFGMFTRLHHRGIYKGSGLGLALCRNIVEDMGGRIEIDSELGEGSTFTIYLKKTSETVEKQLQYIGYD